MINYRGTPLFGEGSSVSHTSEFFAISGTLLFWLLFLIFSLVIKPQPKKQYKEVQIVLSSTPVVQKTEESPAPAEAASASAAASEPVVSETVEPPAPKNEPVQKTVEKPAAKPVEKKTLKAAKPKEVPVTYAVDPMEAFENQTKQQPKKAVDWDAMFDDDTEESSDSAQAKTVQNNVPAFSGSAGEAAKSENTKVTSSSTSNNKNSQNVSSDTSSALQNIKSSTFHGNAVNGVQSETNANAKTSGSGRVEMEMSNGRSRALINPASPVITLSPAAAATIDTSKTVSISFKVLGPGNVTDISITPESILTSIVREEIKNQISQWLFEAADYTATASFEYKIIKK